MSTLHNESEGALAPAFVAGLAALGIYALTMSQSVGWHDSAELALTGWLPAPSHAPGSPVHAVFGFVFARLASQAWFGTTLLSVLSTAIATGSLAWLLIRLGCGKVVALTAAVLFAVSFSVWAGATVTEVYGLGMMCLAATLLAGWCWQQSGTTSAWLSFVAWYGLALGAYFANILLFPVLVWFIYLVSDRPGVKVVWFALLTGLAVLLIAAGNYMLAKHAFPFGAVFPDTSQNMWLYMSGAQHDPLEVRAAAFYTERVVEHAEIFARSVGYLSLPLALCGVLAMDGVNRRFGLLVMGVFLIYMGYYTLFGSGDYYLMVVPAYFVLALWAGLGTAWLIRLTRRNAARVAAYGLLLVVTAGLLFYQLDGRRAMAQDRSAEEFVANSFDLLPKGALAVAGWRELTPLVYRQEVEQKRVDLRFILPARTQRHYMHGTVADYLPLVESSVCQVPVYTMKQTPELVEQYLLSPVPDSDEWFRVEPLAGC